MTDIVEKLVSANGDVVSYDVVKDTVRVKCNDLTEAVREIKKLRATNSNDGHIIAFARAEIERLGQEIKSLRADISWVEGITDVVPLLIKVSDLKIGDPFPDDFGENWGPPMSKMCRDAADEIILLRAKIIQLRSVAGAVSLDGPLMPASVSINEPLPMEET